MSNDLYDPIVIDPPGFDLARAWASCDPGPYVHEDGEPNWRAAFSADPGVVSCPVCKRHHWAWGRIQRCTGCGFEYHTDWWPMYSWGCQAARKGWGSGDLHERRMVHPYYRYGYMNPVEGSREEKDRIDWRGVLSIGGRRVIHIRPYRDDLTTTLCGLDLAKAGYVLHESEVDDEPMPGATGVDLRCPHCWEVWRIRERLEHEERGPS